MAIRCILLSLLLFTAPLYAAANCENQLHGESLVDATGLNTRLQAFDALNAQVQEKLGRASVQEILSSEELPLMRKALEDVLAQLQPATTVADLNQILTARLELRVPPRQVGPRVQGLQGNNAESLRQALGYKTLAEMQELVYGADPLNPSAESLIGKYLAETNAARVTRTFANGPTAAEGQGAPKLAIALSPARQQTFLKYFNFPELMMHYHTPSQGTLLIYFNGQKLSYSGNSRQPLSNSSFTNDNMILPFILLSSSEANRAANYFQLGGIHNTAKIPWDLPGYCAMGGYNSCTHWFGEMPIGDTLLASYSFPGHVDQHAGSAVREPGPQTQPLTNYWESPNFQAIADNVNMPGAGVVDPSYGTNLSQDRVRAIAARLIRLVWRNPGHMPLADTIGEEAAKLRGEFANPGYIAHVLTGRISNTRVPVIFKVQADDSNLDAGFNPNIHGY